jgi:phosphoribosylformylglycinamidine synthase II
LVVRIEGSRADVEAKLRDAGVHLTVEEAHRIRGMIGRHPSRTELYIFDIMWSEHCSYKSSRHVLKEHLPTEGSRVILGPGEDAGVVRLGAADGVNYVLVVAHESHNHPSQILPVEGAATGIGGIVRDVYCMGADVVGVMDALRFGDPAGPRAETVKEIFAGVVRGIWEYGNALGVPNVGGDVFFDRAYDENCLVNVIALGVAREEEIIRSRVPLRATEEPYDLLIVGKPTDMSGLGGATMASRILDVGGESGFSTVQIHDPFLKRVLTEATKSALEFLRREGAEVGYKDLGAGGISCAVTEVVGAGGFGADIDLGKVHTASETMEAFAIACSETQERYCLAVPARLSAKVAAIYNDDFELPHIYRGARASIVGRATAKEQVVMRHRGQVVVDLPVELVTRGISYCREAKPRPRVAAAAPVRKPEIGDLARAALAVVSMLSNASKHYIYRHYDSEVKGASVLKPGEADACVVAVAATGLGIATSVDGNPRYSRLDAYLGAVHAVAESARNVAAVGAVPITLTDCLNFGNPEDPHVFQDFVDTVRGIGDAARGIRGFDTGEAIPIVSGNVSFYNESQSGAAVPPSPIIACYGVLADYSAAVSLGLKQAGDHLVHVGRRGADLGGSALYASLGKEGFGSLPPVDLDSETRAMHAVIEIVTRRLARASHDISEGGLVTALVEMVLGGWGTGAVGARIDIQGLWPLEPAEVLFSEGGGFVLEVPEASLDEVMRISKTFGAEACCLGETTKAHELVVAQGAGILLRLGGEAMSKAYFGSLERAVD